MLKKQGNNKTRSKTKRIIAVAVCYLTIGGGVGVMAGSHFTDVLADHPNGAHPDRRRLGRILRLRRKALLSARR